MVDLNGFEFLKVAKMTMKFNEPLKLMAKKHKKRTFFHQNFIYILLSTIFLLLYFH